jgi:hypothetical protein
MKTINHVKEMVQEKIQKLENEIELLNQELDVISSFNEELQRFKSILNEVRSFDSLTEGYLVDIAQSELFGEVLPQEQKKPLEIITEETNQEENPIKGEEQQEKTISFSVVETNLFSVEVFTDNILELKTKFKNHHELIENTWYSYQNMKTINPLSKEGTEPLKYISSHQLPKEIDKAIFERIILDCHVEIQRVKEEKEKKEETTVNDPPIVNNDFNYEEQKALLDLGDDDIDNNVFDKLIAYFTDKLGEKLINQKIRECNHYTLDTFQTYPEGIRLIEKLEVLVNEGPPEKAKIPYQEFNDIIRAIDKELDRINWTEDQAKNYLMQEYGRKSRLQMSDEQLLNFLKFLQNQ